jgi:SAM-dependent methyltransferase
MEDTHWWFLARREILQALLHEVVPADARKKLIDVGCGTGGLTNFFSNEYEVTGVEPSDDAIAFAQQKFPTRKFIHGMAPDDVREEFRSADGILLIEVLEHIEHDAEFVHTLIAAMKPGAILVMMAPSDPSLWGPHDDAFEHFRRYKGVDGFRELWRNEPVDELLASCCNARLYPLVKAMRVMSRLRGKSWGKGGTDISVPMKPINMLLRSIFRGEKASLLRKLRTGAGGYRKGVSVVAVLKKR